jgi:hypothetical protein
MNVGVKVAIWSSISFPLWIVFSAALRDLGIPVPNGFGAALAWVAAGFLLELTLPLFGHHLGLPWVYAYP